VSGRDSRHCLFGGAILIVVSNAFGEYKVWKNLNSRFERRLGGAIEYDGCFWCG